MDDFLRSLEEDLDELAKDLLGGEELAAEFRADRAAFLGAEAGERAAERRHLEWFLLERECEAIGSVPLEVAVELRTHEDEERARRYAALRGSRAGIFVVSRVDPEEGLLLDELLGRGQYVIDELLLAGQHEPGDLLVGRIFPRDLAGAGERTTWCLSSGAASLRSPELLEALQRDVEAMRQRSRGPLRMTQAELELMFFRETLEAPASETPTDAPTDAPTEQPTDAPTEQPTDAPTEQPTDAPTLAERLTSTRAQLLEGGLPEERWAELLELLRARPLPEGDLALGGDDPLGWILDELAFETDLDLERTRGLLAELWSALQQEAPKTTADSAPELDVRAALARFDEGREAGVDVDALFAALEAELGLEPDEEDDEHRVPDLPGVLGALMQEYLWDGARLAGQELDAFVTANRELELLVRFGSFLGTAEELDLDHLRVFLGRWIWEQPEVLAGQRDLGALAGSMTGFLTWLGDHHGHALGVGGELEELRAEFEEHRERVLDANRTLARLAAEAGGLAAGGQPTCLRRRESGCWEDATGSEIQAVPTGLPSELRDGDWLVCLSRGDQLQARLVLPPIEGPHLKATS